VETPDILIVGGGPAGCATALHLAASAPARARNILVLEKGRHPRHKVCAGGLIPHTLDCLAELGILLDVPHALVHDARVVVPRGEVEYRDRNLCAVVRRCEFDAHLARTTTERGIEVREDEKIVEIARDADGVRVVTQRHEYRPRVLVGADGSGSLVRRALFDEEKGSIGRAVMCDVDAASIGWSGVSDHRYVFDFRAVPAGLKGYVWEFPCWIDGRPHVNIGAYALDRGERVSLPRLVREHASNLGASPVRLEAFPIRVYDPDARIGGDGALLVGDAAGCDPLMGEGISYAFEYARLAAAMVEEAFRTGDFGLGGYTERVRVSWFGKKLRRLRTTARFFYGSAWRPAFAIAARSRRLQDAGIRWYNGVDGWDRAGGWASLRRLLAGTAR
jgi:geranylgeranyl reductase family protein